MATFIANSASKNIMITDDVTTRRASMNDESIKFHASDFLSIKQEDLLHDYDLGDLLGEGGFGLVYSCIHRATLSERAVKMLKKDHDRPLVQDNIINEFNMLKDLDHPNLVKVYDLYQDDECFFIVTDLYMGGDVFEVLEEKGALEEEDAAVVMNNLLACVNYFHKRNLIHRDLKPENILLDAKRTFGDLKVIDFGLACYTEYFGDETHGLVGSAYYVSPQVISGTYTNKCDLWSCGVIAYALLSGFAPFDASTDGQVLDLVFEGRFDFDDPEWDHVSDTAKDFIAQLMSYDEKDRPSAEEALQHPWLKRFRQSSRMNNALVRSNSRDSLRDLSKFESKSNKLKQAVCAIIASHLLTKQEKALVDDAFRALDKTCSGQISKRDLNSSMHSLFRPGDDDDDDDDDGSHEENSLKDGSDHSNGNEHSHSSTAELVDNIFEQVNFSGSGAIQYSEFSVAMILEKNLVTDDKLRAAFKFFDKKDKGFIVKEDLAPILKLGNRGCLRIIQENASNSDKDRITFEDFKKCVLPERRRKEEQTPTVMKEPKQPKFKGLLGGPMDESSRRQRPAFLDESSNRRGEGRPMDESSRRQPLHRSNRHRDSVTTPIDTSKRGHLEKLPE